MTLEALVTPLGIQKQAFAAEIGARPETVSRWFSGKNVPSGKNFGRILSFLNRPENLRKLGRRKPLSFEEVFGSKAA